MAEKPIFKGVSHVAVVVKDLDEAMKRYWEEYGIGPWDIHTFDPSTVSDMIIRNERVDHAFRLAGTKVGDFRLELIEPLDDRCVYAEFLKEHGEGLHHVGFTVDNYDEATAFFQGKGIGVLHGGTWHGTTYAYLESEDTLSFIAEIDRRPEGWEEPAPEATYPYPLTWVKRRRILARRDLCAASSARGATYESMLKRMTMRRFGERWDVAAQAVSIVYPAPPSMMRMHLVLDGDQIILSGGTRNDYGAISV